MAMPLRAHFAALAPVNPPKVGSRSGVMRKSDRAASVRTSRSSDTWAFAALMDPGLWSPAELKIACQRRIAGLRGGADPFLLVDCVENYLQLDPRELAEFEALRSRRENRKVRAMAMTWSETQQAKGREEGLVQGAQRGARQLLLHQLGKRFGPLPDNVRRRVETITSLDRLTELAERVLSAHSLEEMGLA